MKDMDERAHAVSPIVQDAYSHAVVNANQFVTWHSQIITDQLPDGITIAEIDDLINDLNKAVEQICKQYGVE